MFQRALVVKVVGDAVTFAVRTNDSRVDEFKFSVDRFRAIIADAKVEGDSTHIYILVEASYYTVIFSVYTPDFSVMVSEFDAQVK